MSECRLFNHVRYIARILAERLPNFSTNFIQLEPLEWHSWIKLTNLKFEWHHFTSPIIWKELIMRKGKAYLIGGASEFWEYCFDYYNLESVLTNLELEQLVLDSKQHDAERKELEQKPKNNELIICIKGNKKYTIPELLADALVRCDVVKPKQIIIRICKEDFMLNDDGTDLSVFCNKFELVQDLTQGLEKCDLLIIVGDYTRKKDEEFYSWLHRNKIAMEMLADEINKSAETCIRIIVGVHGPVCFDTAILMDNVTKTYLYNIVAVTSDAALEPLNLVSKLYQLPLKDLFAPPVWGFIGINQIIDLEHIVQRYDVYRPNIRAVRNNYESSLQLGKYFTELRYLTYMSKSFTKIWTKLKYKHDSNPTINRLGKVRAIINLIHNWYDPTLSDNIISLGIMSNGKFGIPAGVVFSQPVILKNNKWIPMKSFPVPRKDPCGIEDLVPFILEIYKRYHIRDDVLNTLAM